MANTIKTTITLEGTEDIKKNLEEIGKVGEAAIEQIGKAADDSGLEQLGSDSETATEALAKLAEASQQSGAELDKVKQSTDQAAEATSNFSLQTAKLVGEIAKLSTEVAQNSIAIAENVAGIVLLVKARNSLIETFTKLATTASTTVRAIELLLPVLGPAALALGTVGAAAAGVAIGLEAAGEAAKAVAAPYEKLNHELTMLAQSTGQSFEQLQRGEALFGQLGVSASSFRGVIAKVAEAMKGLDVTAELKKSADTIIEANKKVLEAEKAVIENRLPALQAAPVGGQLFAMVSDLERLKQIQKELNSETDKAKALEDALLEARSKAAEAAANSLSKVLEQVKAIEAGQKGITFDSLVKGETIAKAVAISLKQAEESGKNAGKVLVDLIANATRAQAIEIGKKFGIDEEQVDRIKRLGGHLNSVDEIWKRIQAAGVLIPPESAATFEQLRTQIQATDQAWARLQQAWDSSIFARLAAELGASVSDIKAGFINLAASAVEAFNTIVAAVAEGARVVGSFIALGASITWDAISGAGVNAWNAVVGAIQGAITAVGNFASSILTITWDAISSAGVAAWNAITGAINSAVKAVKNFLGFKGDAPAATGAQGFARGGMIGGRGSGTSDSNLAWVSRGEYVMPAGAVRQPGVLAFLEMLRRGGRVPGFADGGVVSGAVDKAGAVKDGVENVKNTLEEFENDINELLTALSGVDLAAGFDAVLGAIQQLRDAAGGGGFARGGMIGGRGSGTSDSNLAWVSRGEYVMPAGAVRQPGVLAFLEMLRRGGDLSRLLDGLGRFAMGGPVGMPALAGGSGGNLGTLTLGLPSGGSVNVRATSAVVEQLQREAALAQVRSGGRKPSRYT